jgi:phosphate:Na+ symporter
MTTVLLGLAGGLGLFLYGMKLMSDGIEKAAGAKLREILEVFTRNKLSGLIVGIIFTGIIQSSSAATVMVVSFVNAGLMDLYQAAGIIFGANIGTTVTSQLVSFNLSAIAPLFLLAGVIMIQFIDNPTVKKVGEVVLGFGILFTGLTTMKDSMSFLKDSEGFVNLLMGLTNPILAVLIGFVITSILQSSSVTVSIVLLMASQGLLELQICFFIVLGCNIGACSSALLASLGGKKNAKRAALIHFLFNVIGSIIFFVVLLFIQNPLADFIINFSGGDMGRAVANTHTSFKIVQVLLLFPFSNLIVKMTYLLVRGDDEEVQENELKYIGDQSLYAPSSAIPQATLEIERMGNMAVMNLERAMTDFLNESTEHREEINRMEDDINTISAGIIDYLVKINQYPLPVADKKTLGGLFHIVSDIERISDHAKDIADMTATMLGKNRKITLTAKEALIELYQQTDDLLLKAIYTMKHNSDDYVDQIIELENNIDLMEKKMQKDHVKRLAQQICDPQAGLVFSDILTKLERVADHGVNIIYITLTDNTNLLDEDQIAELK